MPTALTDLLTHPLLTHAPLALQLSALQLVALLLAALAASHAYRRMPGSDRAGTLSFSAQVMLAVALLSIVLTANLPTSDAPGHVDAALMVRIVLGGAFVSAWHTLRTRLTPLRATRRD
ncbi:hypothetical protein [Deinococcus aquiradiocola]|nr:hypothetical protein [Deinococcus aquiradiocola]